MSVWSRSVQDQVGSGVGWFWMASPELIWVQPVRFTPKSHNTDPAAPPTVILSEQNHHLWTSY